MKKIHVRVIHVSRDLLKQIAEVVVRSESVRLCRFCQAVEYCAGFRSMDGIDQMPVVFAYAEGADRLLCRVVVQWDIRMIQERAQVESVNFFL